MAAKEKLFATETLWSDLSRNADTFEYPAWHGDVLRERDQSISEGNELSVDWNDAKRQLRERLNPL